MNGWAQQTARQTRFVILVSLAFGIFGLVGTAHGAGQYLKVDYPGSTAAGELRTPVTYTLWIPDGAPRLRGIIVHQHGAGTTASIEGSTAAYDLHWQALAAKWDCALFSSSYHVSNEKIDLSPGGSELWFDPRHGSEKTFLEALSEFAAKSGHAEIETVPWALWGHSGGGIWADVMSTLHPERIAVIWMRSGSALMFRPKPEFPQPEVPAGVYAIPSMCNPGVKEKPNLPWVGTLATFKEYRAKGAFIGFAPDPRTGHECGDSRYLAIPFFDACLAMRLPDKGSKDQTLKPVDQSHAWLATPLSDQAVPAASYQGDPKEAVWLPNEVVAKAWMEYVKTGAVSDTTPPPAPYAVKATDKGEQGTHIEWSADADFESGIRCFTILRDGQELVQVPQTPIGKFGRPLFQSMTYHDTPAQPLAKMQYVDASPKLAEKHAYAVVAVNSVGLKSEPSASIGDAIAPMPQLPGIGAAIQAAMDAREIAGAVTVVVAKDKVLHLQASGLADIAAAKPMQPDARFWIASMTKPVTAVAVLMLQDEGKLSVADPVAKYIPAFADLKTPSGRPANLTVTQILTHTSGLGEAPAAAAREAHTLADLVPLWLAAPMQYEPGAKWQYTQSGINLAARIVEIVSGLSFDTFVQQRILDPLGMRNTTFYPADGSVVTAYAKNRTTGALDPTPPRNDFGVRNRPPLGNGGLYSTGPDYARFCQMLLGGGVLEGKRYLSPAAMERLTTVQTGALPCGFFQSADFGNHGANYGWGIGTCILRAPHEGVAAMLSPGTFGHGGAWGTQAWIDPVRGVAHILMVQRSNFPNSDASDVRRAFQQAAADALAKPTVGTGTPAQSKHAPTTKYPSYNGLVMAGYQGWFRVGRDGQMYPNETRVRIDMWPDVSEYEKTYPTGLKLADGSTARFFNSADQSTVNLHFKWMKDYGLDGVFMQRFFGSTRPNARNGPEVDVLRFAFQAASENERAIAVMYDLSGLRNSGENCLRIADDWKFLVDTLKATNQPGAKTYLHHRGRPLVVIWGVGFPDRGYDIKNIALDKLIDFLHNDPEYGGCSVMLGVPTFWRDLNADCRPEPYLHELIKKADLVLPWMVQRFSPLLHNDMWRYRDVIKADMKWCQANGVDYVPCVYPGFSWHNLSRFEFPDDIKPVGSIPRQGGRFYWQLVSTALGAGADKLYVAMFDEVNEGTAIFKCTDHPPVSNVAKFIDMDGKPSDHYLWLTGEAGKMLRKEKPLSTQMPKRE